MQPEPEATQQISDPLTGAYSRALLAPRLAEELSRASRSTTGCALFLFDVDYFKSVNDAYGHQRGDDILCQVVERINGLLRGYDILFRYGGDEFVLLLPDTTKADAIRVAMRITDGVKATPFAGDPPLTVSVSLGVAAFPEDATDADGLLAAADRRNYLAKQRGRACAVVDDVESDDARPVSARLLERDVPLAAARDFLTRVIIGEPGALRVSGDPGAGHSRFLEEVARTGRLRGFDVVDSADPDRVAVADPSRPLLAVLDSEVDTRVLAMVDRVRASGVPTFGVVFRSRLGVADAAEPGVPVHETVELRPWSPAAVRIWLRTALPGEPSTIMVDWLTRRTGGLPARVARELDRLRERGGLLQTDAGWTIAPAVLNRGSRRRPLPVPLTELVGRQQETAQVAQLLAERRLVTLVGPGGIGKTRLSLAVAGAVAETFDDGVTFVAVDDARTEDEVLAALAAALDVAEVPGQSLLESISEHLDEQSMLLVLDNFEQAREASGVLGDLLADAPRVKMLVSSRERLGLYGEQRYAVPPLGLPDLDALQPTPSGVALALAGSSALALFNARAHAAAFDFAVTAESLVPLATLCHRLDGLPLAIELAAAHADAMSPAELLAQLTDRLELPGAAPRGVPERQRTLRATIDWSYARLEPAEQVLLVRLGAFAGGARLDAIEAVSTAGAATAGRFSSDVDDLPKRLARLVETSLVRAEPEDGEQLRYVLLETVRAYAAERLDGSGEAGAVRLAHATHFAAFAEAAGVGLIGSEQSAWAVRIQREYQNLRAAYEHCLGRRESATAARHAVGLWRFWRNSGRLREGRTWLNRLLHPAVALPDAARAQVLHAAAVLAAAQDDHDTARTLALESLDCAHEVGDVRTAAQARNALGIAAMTADDFDEARGYFADSLIQWQQLGEPFGMAMAYGNLTMVALGLGELDVAGTNAVRCLELERAQGNIRGIMLALLCLGEIRLQLGDASAARTHLAEALALSRSAGDVFGEAMALHELGAAALAAGDPGEAVRCASSALALRRDADDRKDLAVSLETVAAMLVPGVGDPTLVEPALAARLLGAAEALRLRHRLPAAPNSTADRLREVLPAEALELHLANGRGASLDSVVDEVLAHVPAKNDPSDGSRSKAIRKHL